MIPISGKGYTTLDNTILDYIASHFKEALRSGCITGGMPDARCRSFQDKDELLSVLRRFAKPGDVILFKGSHGMHMETVLEAFLADKI